MEFDYEGPEFDYDYEGYEEETTIPLTELQKQPSNSILNNIEAGIERKFTKDDVKDFEHLWKLYLGMSFPERIKQLEHVLSRIGTIVDETTKFKMEKQLHYMKLFTSYYIYNNQSAAIEDKIKYALKLAEFSKDPITNMGKLWFFFSPRDKKRLKMQWERQPHEYIKYHMDLHISNLRNGE